MTRLPPAQETWVMRRFRLAGARYDPERVCEYTGFALNQFPLAGTPQIGYWRADGRLVATRAATAQEIAWQAANPALMSRHRQAFDAWRANLTPKSDV